MTCRTKIRASQFRCQLFNIPDLQDFYPKPDGKLLFNAGGENQTEDTGAFSQLFGMRSKRPACLFGARIFQRGACAILGS
jgi:hypothetical protein